MKSIDLHLWGLNALLLFALFVGGGGTPAELNELLVQLFFIAAFGFLYFTDNERRYSWKMLLARDRLIGALWIALLTLAFVHLVPLPPELWSSLPGRAVIWENLKAFDKPTWQPLSIAPNLTFASLLSLLPPLVAYNVASASSAKARSTVLYTFLLFGVATVMLQLMQTTGQFFPYEKAGITYTNGFQANRNSQADILVFLLIALGLRPRRRAKALAFVLQQGAIAAVFLAAIVLTGSRSGMVLGGLVMPFVIYCTLSEISFRRRLLATIASVSTVITAVAGFIVASGNEIFGRALSRFGATTDGRFDLIWPDAIDAARDFLPWGAGFGAFVPAFQIFESQETFIAEYANRAHNEPLELAIEGGAPLLVIVLLGILTISYRAVGGLLEKPWSGRGRRAAFLLGMLIVISVHSLVDYPMRSMSIAVLFAIAVGLVVADRNDSRSDQSLIGKTSDD